MRAVRDHLVDKEMRDFNFDMIYADQSDGSQIISFANSLPMMAERRVVIVSAVQKLSVKSKNVLLNYIDAPLESTCLVLTAQQIDKRQSFFSKLIKKAVCFESKRLYENQALEWTAGYFSSKGIKVDQAACQLLVQKCGTSVWHIKQEIDKVIVSFPSVSSLSASQLEPYIGFSRKYNVWELTDKVAKKDLRAALEIAHHLLEEGQSPTGLIIDLYNRIWLLLKIRCYLDTGMTEKQAAEHFKLNYFFSRLYLSQVRLFSQAELRAAILMLGKADIYIKTGYMQIDLMVDFLLHGLIKSKKELFC